MTNQNPHYPAITPYLCIKDANGFIRFLQEAFDAKERLRHEEVGRLRHAEIAVGDSLIMVSEGGRENYQSRTGMFYVALGDCDTYYHKAIKAGAKSIREPRDEEYGDRSAGVTDAFGNEWWLAGPMKGNNG